MLKFRGPSVLAAQQDYFLNDTGEEPEEGEQVQHSTSGVVSVAKKNQEDEYTERRMHESYTDVCGEMGLYLVDDIYSIGTHGAQLNYVNEPLLQSRCTTAASIDLVSTI